ncbi:MAG: 5'-nucleotidase C-terminal domain-containing protein [Deltaproteobacteria bacterium]|nr:5'-nucleotidase C-terminal domain-containing protein [Deltaproteobacteria bacterium]
MNGLQSNENYKRCLRFLVLVLLLCLWACTPAASKPDSHSSTHHLVVLFTNDTHGHPVKFQYGQIPDVGGLPARATLVKEIRDQHPNVLVLDAGDLNTGSAESDLFKAEPDIVGYNYIGYDAMALGNHEFDNPLDVLNGQMARAAFPFLSANVRTREGDRVGTPYIIKAFDGFKVAIIGLTAKETRITGNPQHIREMVFQDEVDAARALVPMLRREGDIVIALTHLGVYEDNSRGSRRLAAQVGGIDLIVDGNTHTKLTAPVVVRHPDSGGDAIIVQAWQYGLVLGRIDLWIRERRIIDYTMELIPINLKKAVTRPDGGRTYEYIGKEIEEDPELLKILQPYMDKVEGILSEEIGFAEATFWNRHQRKRETALGDLVADSMLWYMGKFNPDFAFTNAGAIRADLAVGPIKKKGAFDILPFDSTAVVLRLKGTDVASLFDYVSTIRAGEGAFPQVSDGVRFTLNRLTGKCEDIRIRGQAIDPDRTYTVVTNSYLADGGDGYKVFLKGFDQVNSSTPQRDILVKYIKHLGGRIRPKIHGRIQVISGPESVDEIEGYSHNRILFHALAGAPAETR